MAAQIEEVKKYVMGVDRRVQQEREKAENMMAELLREAGGSKGPSLLNGLCRPL